MAELEAYIIRYKNLMRRSFVGILGSISILILLFLFIQYRTTLNSVKTGKLNRLLGIANTVSVQLDGDIHDRLVSMQPEKDDIKTTDRNGDYLTLHQVLKDAKLVNQLETPIYTLLLTDEEKNTFQSIVTSDEVYYRHIYTFATNRLIEKYKEGGMLDRYSKEKGEWLTAFAPIINSRGQVVGIVMVDEEFDTFITIAKSLLFKQLFILALGLLIVGLAIYWWMRRSFKKMEGLNKVLENMVYARTNDLKVSNQKLIEFNQNLENTVAERTKALKIANKKLIASNESLQHFAHTASHDLKEPLRMIASYTQLLSRRFVDPNNPTAKEFIFFILDGTKRMQILIDDILAFSQVDADDRAFEVIDLNGIVSSVSQTLKSRIEEKNATIETSILPTVKGNHTQLIQLFQNLISNGIKFNEQQPVIKISSVEEKRFWQIAIADNGIGIKEEHFKTIFTIFKRLHNRRDFSGTGIGLATCKKIVEKHGGKLTIESVYGEGTTFYFTLPKEDKIEIKNKEQRLENEKVF